MADPSFAWDRQSDPENPLEQALRLSEARYRQLLESLSDYVYTVVLENGNVVTTIHGPGAVAVTGYMPEEYDADPLLWLHMVPREDRKAVIAQAMQVRAGRTPPPLEHRIIHKDGSIHWVSNTSVPRFDAQGRVIGYEGLVTDITLRRQAEEQLREREAQYHALFQSSADAIFVESFDGRILDCNEAACRMYGIARHELLQKTVADLVPPEVAQALPEITRKILRKGGLSFETENIRCDGERFPCEITIRMVGVGSEQLVIAYVRDLSELRRAEESSRRQLEAETRAAAAEAARAELDREIAERKRMEKELRESEERFRTTFEKAAVGITHVSPEGTFLRVNRRFCEIVGYSEKEILRHSFQDITFPGDLQADMELLAETMAGKRSSYSLEKRYLRKDGSLVWVYLTVTLLRDRKNQPKHFISIIEDITERKRAEEALRLEEVRMEALLRLGEMIDASEAQIADFALEEGVRLTQSEVGYLHFVDEDQRNLRLFTWSKGVDESCLAHRDGHYPIEEAGVWVDCVRQRRPVIHNDYQNLPHKKGYPEGHFHVVRHLSVPVLDGERVVAVAGVGNKAAPYEENDARQLSLFMSSMYALLRRKQAEQDLRQALRDLRQLEFIVNQSDAVVFLWRFEPGLPVEFVSNNVARYGYTPQDFTEGSIQYADMIYPEDQPRLLSEVQRYIDESQSEFNQEYRILTAAGEQRWLRGRTWVRRDELGRPTHFQGLVYDITDWKKVEDYMLRTERLAAMGHVAAALAHEIKNPLQAIQSNLELLIEYDLPIEERVESLRFSIEEIERLNEITGRMLGFVRPSENTHPVPVSAPNLVRHALALGNDAIKRGRIHVQVDLPDFLPPVLAIPGQITQVLLNLVLNAAEAMSDGGRLEISARSEEVYLALLLKNDGPSIPSEQIGRLFEPFFTTKPNSTGLGLFVSHNILQQLGGSIEAANSPDGHGVIFTLRLPLADYAEQPAPGLNEPS